MRVRLGLQRVALVPFDLCTAGAEGKVTTEVIAMSVCARFAGELDHTLDTQLGV